MVVYLSVCPSCSLVAILEGKYVRVLVGFRARLGNYNQDDNNNKDDDD